ncbi:unnamed protein product [Penicillium roqueforti FM164]|uniref:Genomic scaffold, ProqFM164S02 n=1 Tax=Penicillium roqueforti (strain FM164) TaxID=1365484 RepID=W6Q7I6_PENRF|nr:unnamed protein product [Penicillium roqueforti FM164]
MVPKDLLHKCIVGFYRSLSQPDGLA